LLGSLHGLVYQFAETAGLEAANGCFGGAVGRGDLVAQFLGLDVGLLHHEFGGAEDRLDGEAVGVGAGQSGGFAGIAQGGGKFKHVGRAAAAQAGDGVEQVFGGRDEFAEGAEDRLDDLAVVGCEIVPGAPCGDAGADLALVLAGVMYAVLITPAIASWLVATP
jgi:hypothetical protein